MTDVEGKHIGRNDKLLGANGTNIIVLTPFKTIGPPDDKA
jgi:hypothetical protein